MRQRSIVETAKMRHTLDNVQDVTVLDNGALRVMGDTYVVVFAPGEWLTVTTTAVGR